MFNNTWYLNITQMQIGRRVKCTNIQKGFRETLVKCTGISKLNNHLFKRSDKHMIYIDTNTIYERFETTGTLEDSNCGINKNKIGQWNGTESPGKDHTNTFNSTFDKEQTVLREKGASFQQMKLGITDIHMRKFQTRTLHLSQNQLKNGS